MNSVLNQYSRLLFQETDGGEWVRKFPAGLSSSAAVLTAVARYLERNPDIQSGNGEPDAGPADGKKTKPPAKKSAKKGSAKTSKKVAKKATKTAASSIGTGTATQKVRKVPGHGEAGKSLIIIAPTNQEAESMAVEAAFYLERELVAYFPGYEGIPYEYTLIPREVSLQRIRVLHRILAGIPLLIFTSPEGVLRKMPDPDRMRSSSIGLKRDMTLDPEDLIRRLVGAGYDRVERVDLAGEFCVKGSLVDIFPANAEYPIRLDFFDDILESIHLFNPDTQIGVEKIEAMPILPVGEIVLSMKESEELLELLQTGEYGEELLRPEWVQDGAILPGGDEEVGAHHVISQLHHGGIQEVYPLVDQVVDFVSIFADAPETIIFPAARVRDRAEQLEREYRTLFEQERNIRICLTPDELLTENYLKPTDIPERTGSPSKSSTISENLIELDEIGQLDATPVEAASPETSESAEPEAPSGPFQIVRRSEGFRGRVGEVREKVLDILDKGGVVCITSPYTAQLGRLAGIFKAEKNIKVKIKDDEKDLVAPEFKGKNTVWVCRASIREGYYLPANNFYLWSDADIFGRSYRRRSRFKKARSTPLDSFIDLKENDYVVHVNHGVGRFLKLERVTAAGRERDFLVLEYADDDRLYVPLDQISMVQKYIAHTESPKLDSLGKSSFKRIKERVEKKIEELAEDLIQLYAVRMSQKGFAFPPDTAWQEQFESEFLFDETPDQINAIESVKNDMESPRPMDRLICGDVGYGKTEVAIRAVFKAVMAGRQAAVIAPTTILALQHFRTFKERFKNYPVNVDWISRFRTRAEVTALKKKLKEGEIDVIIGTHALLAEDVRIKNLGLLVVDEEQRFGVGHKESIKNIKKLIDVMVLSATPIPRTLHMSLVGIRDLSIIQTAPHNRMPIQTFVTHDSDSLLKEAVHREIDRGGQVFYLHNRVQSIEVAARRLETLCPGISYTVLHGQMLEEEVEDILIDFMNKKYDVLVTTTIIESGIDIPNVNTLIVDRSDTFGLSQLYQIRGRVGRSNRQAYAYLFHPGDRVLTEKAQRRLNTIQEYQELGSGFKVAMRDLEIRGAGNVLGKEQSGDIMDVGFELYVKLLDSAVKRLQGQPTEQDAVCSINLNRDFFLPEDYIHDTRQRIEFYKRFEGALDRDEVEALALEMRDRFGDPPILAQNFILMEKVRTLASRCGFETVLEENKGQVRLKAGENFKAPMDHVIQILKTTPSLSVAPEKPGTLIYRPKERESSLEGLVELLQKIAAPVLEAQAAALQV